MSEKKEFKPKKSTLEFCKGVNSQSETILDFQKTKFNFRTFSEGFNNQGQFSLNFTLLILTRFVTTFNGIFRVLYCKVYKYGET